MKMKPIKMDLQQCGITPVVDAVQDEAWSRELDIELQSGNKPYYMPENTAVVICYQKADKTGGMYDTLPDNTPAWNVSGNMLSIKLSDQALTFPGRVLLTVSLIHDGTRLNTFPIEMNVSACAQSVDEESKDYFNITGFLIAPGNAKAGQLLQVTSVDAQGKVTGIQAVDSESSGSGSLDAAQLQLAIKDYLTANPPAQGSPGRDGTSVTHTWNGTVLTLTSASGTSSVDLKGPAGEPGPAGATGPAGADGNGIASVSQTSSVSADSVTFTLDSGEVYTLTARHGTNGQNGVSPTVEINKSGNVTTISITDINGTKTASIIDGESGSPSNFDCKNWIPYAEDETGSIYNEIGYLAGYRINSSGVVTAADQYVLTGYIPFTYGDIARITSDVFSENGGSCAIAGFDSNKTFLASIYVNNSYHAITQESDAVYIFDPIQTTTGNTKWEPCAFIRVTGTTNVSSASIITVNEAIGTAPDNNEGKTYEDRILTLEASNNEFENRIGELENSPSNYTLPDYWKNAVEAGVIATNTALCTAGFNKSAFLFYSDAHWNHNSHISPALLKHLCRYTGMTKTFFGGDIVNTESTDYNTMRYLWEWRRQLKDLPNHHSVVGNHDDGNTTNNLFSQQYVYGYLLAAEETPDIVRGASGLYYYIDNPCEKTRYLCLDTAFQGIDSAQSAFITEALKSTPDNWHIVVIAHAWYQPDYSQASVNPIPITGFTTNASAVVTLLDRYNSRENEFSECLAHVEFCIGGHTHTDYDGSSPGGIPIILVETDSKTVRGNYACIDGTTAEASVNSIIADYDHQKVHVIRIGRGESRTVEL